MLEKTLWKFDLPLRIFSCCHLSFIVRLPIWAISRLIAFKQLSVSNLGTISISKTRTKKHMKKQHGNFRFLWLILYWKGHVDYSNNCKKCWRTKGRWLCFASSARETVVLYCTQDISSVNKPESLPNNVSYMSSLLVLIYLVLAFHEKFDIAMILEKQYQLPCIEVKLFLSLFYL